MHIEYCIVDWNVITSTAPNIDNSTIIPIGLGVSEVNVVQG